MKITQKGVLWSACSALAIVAVSAVLAGADDQTETQLALPAPTIVGAINAAVAAKPGNVAGVEIEFEDGVARVEVEVVATDGKKYEVAVNSQSGEVVSVEADDETDAKNGEPKTEGDNQ